MVVDGYVFLQFLVTFHNALLLKNDISKLLSEIFNLSMRAGTHPDCLKIVMVIPIHKKGSRVEVGNYRPISLLSNINKLLGKNCKR